MNYLEKNIRITVNNFMVSYTDEGKNGAPVIIFIHGFPFNKSMWNMQVEALRDKYRLIAYDIRGHGNSDSGNGDFSIELFAKDLLSLMDALKIDKTILCGLSMGGYIALNAVVNYPGRFNALILSDTHCIADTPEAKEKRMKAIDSIGKNGVKKYADESIKNLFSPESFTTRKEEVAAVREMIVKTSEQSLCNTLLALSVRKETCIKLSEIKIPVLIMVGKEDKITPSEAAHFMHEKIKNSLLSIIDHAGHLSNMENPGEFNGQLKKFIASVYKSQSHLNAANSKLRNNNN
jgi:3-oxoadipate enol-lactonase